MGLVAIVFALVGFAAAISWQRGINFKSDLTIDGLLTVSIAALTVLAATIILPLWIQPQLHRQQEVNRALGQDIGTLLSLIEDMLADYEVKYSSSTPVTIKERQIMLAKHKKVNNLARIINLQTKNSHTIKNFEEDIYILLTQSHGEFSDKAVPRKKLDAATYLSIKSTLDPISYKLQEIRYKLF